MTNQELIAAARAHPNAPLSPEIAQQLADALERAEETIRSCRHGFKTIREVGAFFLGDK